jgi:hypothetical protein
MAVKIFFCYAHEDEALLNKLKISLRPLEKEGLIDVWHDRDISAGAEWEREINKYLNEANIILLLISADFMNSDYCYGKEMRRALEQHQCGEARAIPIILRPIRWRGILGHLQALPTEAKPVSTWGDWDDAFYDVAEGIRQEVVKLLPSNQKGDERQIGQEDKVINSSASKGNIPKWSQLSFGEKLLC